MVWVLIGYILENLWFEVLIVYIFDSLWFEVLIGYILDNLWFEVLIVYIFYTYIYIYNSITKKRYTTLGPSFYVRNVLGPADRSEHLFQFWPMIRKALVEMRRLSMVSSRFGQCLKKRKFSLTAPKIKNKLIFAAGGRLSWTTKTIINEQIND